MSKFNLICNFDLTHHISLLIYYKLIYFEFV